MANGDDKKRIEELEKQLKKQQTSFRNFGRELSGMLSATFDAIGDSTEVVGQKMVTNLSKVKDVQSEILKNANRLNKEEYKNFELGSRSKSVLRMSEDLRKKISKSVSNSVKSEKTITKEERAQLATQLKQSKVLSKQSVEFAKQDARAQYFQEKMKGTTDIFSKMARIPIVGRLMDAGKASEKMKETFIKTGNASKAMVAGFSEMAMSGLYAAPMAFLTAAIKSIFTLDTAITDLSRSEGISYENASKARAEMASSTDDIRALSQDMLKIRAEIRKETGIARDINEDDLATLSKINLAGALNTKQQAKLLQLSQIQGKSVEATYTNMLGTLRSTERQFGVTLDLNKIMGKATELSGEMRAMIGMVPEDIVKAVAQASALGIELESLNSAASSLLNFEQSISKELEAELLTGKQLNLEKARLAALNNDEATLMQELVANIGTYSDFTSMNRLQQEAIAAAVGMQRGELENIFMRQADIATAEEVKRSNEEQSLVNQTLQITAMETLQQTMKGISDELASFVQPVMNFVQKLKDGEGIGKKIKNLFKFGIAVAAAGMVMSIVRFIGAMRTAITLSKALKAAETATAVAKAYGAAMSSPASILTGGIGGLALGATVAAVIYGAIKAFDDVAMKNLVGAGYGDTMITKAGMGTFAMNNQDQFAFDGNNFVAGTELFTAPKQTNTFARSSEMSEFFAEMRNSLNTISERAENPQPLSLAITNSSFEANNLEGRSNAVVYNPSSDPDSTFQ